MSNALRFIVRLVRAVRNTNWRGSPDIGTGQKGIGRLRNAVDQIELVVNSSAGVACHREVGGFARERFIRPIRYADRCVNPYVCAGEEAIDGLDCTLHEVVLGFDRRASITRNGYVGRAACWSFVWTVWDTDGGPYPDIVAVQELVGLLDSTAHQVILVVECGAGVTSNRDVSRQACRRW